MATKPSNLLLPANTPAWLFQVWAAFLVSVFAILFGLYQAPMDRWVRAFFFMGTLFTMGSSFTLAKTIRDNRDDRIDTQAWVFQSWAAFLLSAGVTFTGILWLRPDATAWIQGYLAVSLFFCVNTSFTLSKTIRDNHEAEKVMNSFPRAAAPLARAVGDNEDV